MGMTPEKAKALRAPFPKGSIGQLPKGGTMLDYVGHAATTERLLAVDPEWSWEPMATDERGLPVLDGKGNLWIRLTVCGVTRIGVGDGKSAKEVIGDALRNAAMRFGVAIDLWAKEDLLAFATATPQTDLGPEQRPATADAGRDSQPTAPDPGSDRDQVTRKQLSKIGAQMGDLGLTDRTVALAFVADVIGREISSRNELTRAEASKLIERMAYDLGELPEPTEEA